MKIRTRIILLLSTIFVSFIIVFSLVIYFLTVNYGFSDFYDRLKTRTNTTIRIRLEHKGDNVYIERFKKELLIRLPEEKEFIIPLDQHYQPKITLPTTIEKSFIEDIRKHKSAQLRAGDLFK